MHPIPPLSWWQAGEWDRWHLSLENVTQVPSHHYVLPGHRSPHAQQDVLHLHGDGVGANETSSLHIVVGGDPYSLMHEGKMHTMSPFSPLWSIPGTPVHSSAVVLPSLRVQPCCVCTHTLGCPILSCMCPGTVSSWSVGGDVLVVLGQWQGAGLHGCASLVPSAVVQSQVLLL